MPQLRVGILVLVGLVILATSPRAQQTTTVYSWTTLAGQAVASLDGTAATAVFGHPVGVVALTDGAVLVADRDASAIRRVAADGAVTTFAGRLDTPGWADGALASARFTRPFAFARTANGGLWVGEEILFTGTRIRHITAGGVVSTVAQFSASLRGLATVSNGDLLAFGASARCESKDGRLILRRGRGRGSVRCTCGRSAGVRIPGSECRGPHRGFSVSPTSASAGAMSRRHTVQSLALRGFPSWAHCPAQVTGNSRPTRG